MIPQPIGGFESDSQFQTQVDSSINGLVTGLVGLQSLEARMAGLQTGLEARITGLEARMTGLETRLGVRMDSLGGLGTRLDAPGASLGTRMDALGARIDGPGARVDGLEEQAISSNIWDHLKHLRHKAADPTTLTILKNPWDPNEISILLLGVSLDEASSCLRALRDRKAFAGEELVDIRRLLVKCNLFLRKYQDSPQTPTELESLGEEQSQAYELREGAGHYELEVEKGVTDVGRTDQLLLCQNGLVKLLQQVVNVHLHQPQGEDCVWILKQIIQFINTVDILNIKYDSVTIQSKLGTKSFGSIVLFSQTMLVDSSPRPLVLVPDPNNINVTEEVKGFVSEFLGYMILLGCSRGIMTDGEVLLFIEINLKERILRGSGPLPVTVYASHIKATGPSYCESLISWVLQWMAEPVWDEMEVIQTMFLGSERADRKRSHSLSQSTTDCNLPEGSDQRSQAPKRSPRTRRTKRRNVGNSGYVQTAELAQIPPIRGKAEPLHGKDARFQVLKLKASKVKFLHNLQPHEHLVLKIFDPVAGRETGPRQKIPNMDVFMEAYYSNELKCIQRMSKVPGFNNCYIDHSELWAKVNTPNGWVSGKCLLSKFIESGPLPANEETLERVKQQINVIRDLGIYHNDIAERNILYTKEGKVYIIDFGRSVLDPGEDEWDGDLETWDEVYENMLLRPSSTH